MEIPLTDSEMGRQEIVGRDGSNSAFWAANVSMSMKCITFTAYGPKSEIESVEFKIRGKTLVELPSV